MRRASFCWEKHTLYLEKHFDLPLACSLYPHPSPPGQVPLHLLVEKVGRPDDHCLLSSHPFYIFAAAGTLVSRVCVLAPVE